MDLETLIIGLISLALCVVPVLYFQNRQKMKKIKLLHEFTVLALQHQIKITQHDFWSPAYAIGIDPAKKVLFYTRKEAGKDTSVIVNLMDVKQCKVNNLYRDSSGDRTIDHIELEFVSTNTGRTKTLEFYNREVNLNFNNELLLAEKWKGIVNANLEGAATAIARYA